MAKRPTIWLLLLLLGTGGGVFPASGAERETPRLMLPARMPQEPATPPRETVFRGALDVRIHPAEGKLTPPAELLLLNPAGRKIGKDPRSGRAYTEIPHAYYEYEGIDDAASGAPGPQSGTINLPNPVSGFYRLEVVGREAGRYLLEITAFAPDLKPSKALSRPRRIRKGEAHHYFIHYSPEKGAQLEVTPASFFPEKKAR